MTAEVFARAGLAPEVVRETAAGFGLAGAVKSGNAEAFRAVAPPFATLALIGDSEIACLGAHGGGDGAILVLGTGSQGLMIAGGRTMTVGGWGFALSDGGSGAVLGRAALRRALAAAEGLAPASAFTAALMTAFDDRPDRMLEFARHAAPRDWAAHAPAVFTHAAAGDPVAAALLAEAAGDVAALLDRLAALGATRIALVGGLAGVWRPHLPGRVTGLLVAPQGDALDARSVWPAAPPALPEGRNRPEFSRGSCVSPRHPHRGR
ncbi:Glucosamine kinase GspK [Methylobrevis pamukkalensis]|uniref:Glucosamine kinase GspK n=1 Tax=Methylobrevis pamukkalensis TaxID=1439726 RepID=A0A1E3GYU8_9HYPH|nr:Glucosamine kinase GspK [Methylobrevis pamukkalensis]